MKCPQCHFENSDDLIYGSECASPLKSSEEIHIFQTKPLLNPTDELTKGSTVAGENQIIEKLGEGGMGKIYGIEDTKI